VRARNKQSVAEKQEVPTFDFLCPAGHRFSDLVPGGIDATECVTCGKTATRLFPREAAKAMRFADGCKPVHCQKEAAAQDRRRDHFERTHREKLDSGEWEWDSKDSLDGDCNSSSITSLLDSGHIDAIRTP